MKPEKLGASAPQKDTGPEAVLGGTSGIIPNPSAKVHLDAAIQALSGGQSAILKAPYANLLGGVRVVVERKRGCAFVSVHPKPWGWLNVSREFLNPESPGVARYAARLLDRIEAEGKREHDRRERLKDLRLAERGRP